jgi:glutathione S-transferase
VARILYTSWFSPFARKVAIALELKELPYEAIDALTREFRAELKHANPRAEVPVLIDDGTVVVNSSDILQYLDWQYPQQPLYPLDPKERVLVRALERLADQRLDPIVVDCSFWQWAERDDTPPSGLREIGQRDLDAILAHVESILSPRPKPWPFHAPGVVECAWFPKFDRCTTLRVFGRRKEISKRVELARDDASPSRLCRGSKTHGGFHEDFV